MTDLVAIRARDAEDMDLRYAIPWATALRVDVHDLLAEVDRLTAELDAALEVEKGLGDIIAYEDARMNRIAAAVAGLLGHFDPMCAIEDAPSDHTVVSRFAVLRLLDGE